VGENNGFEVARLTGATRGLQVITKGGLPKGRLSLVTGTAGSGKTIFAVQFLAEGIQLGEPGVFVTFEERPARVRSDVRSFGWDIEEWERSDKWAFVDASPNHLDEMDTSGAFDLTPLLARVRHAIEKIGAQRVAIDSVGALITRFEDRGPARRALFQLGAALDELGVSAVMTGERSDDYGPVGQFGFEEFLADSVILLRNALRGEKRRRTIEVLKLRGGSHLRGEHLFTLQPAGGLTVVPNEVVDLDFESSTARITSGNTELDRMLSGGLLRGSLVFVTGPTGTGKSLLATGFSAGGVDAGDKTLLQSFEESRSQIIHNATEWGIDFEQMEASGRLRILADAPEARSLEDHLLRLNAAIEDFQPDRVAIDSLTALQRVSTVTSFREYAYGIAFQLKARGLLGLFTATAAGSDTESALTDLHVSTVTDTIILLQYVAVGAEMRRGINVLKMRGSDHDKALREFWIDDSGLHIAQPFKGVVGLMAPTSAEGSGIER
jgi:circadian clock protein KaiC